MHFRNTLFTLAILGFVFIYSEANAQYGTGYYAGVPNCEMGGAGTLSKEEKEDALKDKARYKYLEKKLNQITKELKALGREQGVRGDADEIIEHVNGRMNKVKRALGDPALFAIFQKSYTKEWSCEVTGEGKRESSYDLECGPKRIACDIYVGEEMDKIIQERLANLRSSFPDDEVDCGFADPSSMPSGLRRLCPSTDTKVTVAKLEAELNQYVPTTDQGKSNLACSRPEQICRAADRSDRAAYEACTKAMGEVSVDLAQKAKEYNYVLQELEAVAENLGPVDFYTEGSYCFECQQAGNRRFVDDRSGFRKFFDTAMPILGGAAAAYGGYKLTQEAVDRATNLGFTTNPAPSFLSYGWPMIMNGVYGGIASGIGAGMFQCGNTMGGFFPGGANGMMGPFGMQGMMGQGGAFGYPFGQSPYGFNGYGGGPFMPGLVGGYGAGPWGIGGQLGYGFGIPQIMGMPGGGAMGFAGVPGMGAMGMMGMMGGGVPGFGGGFAGMGTMGMMGMPGMGTMGMMGGGAIGYAGIAGLYSVPGAMGIMGNMGFAGVPGMGGIGYAGIPGVAGMAGYAGIPGMAGIAGMAGMYGVAGLQGSIGSSLGLQYQQQLIQQQMMQYQQQMSMLQQYQEYEINRQRTRSQLQQQLQQLQMQLYQLEAGGGMGFNFGGSTMGTTVGTPYFPSPTGTFNPGTNPAR